MKRLAVGLAATVGVVGAVLAARSLELTTWLVRLLEWGRAAGWAGPTLYAAAYVTSTVLLLPGSVLTLGAGYAWGPVWGVALVSPVSVAAAWAAFTLGRTTLRQRVTSRLGDDARVRAMDAAVAAGGLKLVVLLRLSPVLPFNLLNYALSLTRVRTRDYVLGSALGMFPATVLYVYVGSLVTDGAQLLRGERPSSGPAGTVLLWAGLLATLGAVTLLTRASRRALDAALAKVEA